MLINSVIAAYGAKPYEPVATKSDKKAAPEKTAAVLKEQVELSDTSLNMQKIRDAIDSAPEVRIPLVEEIQKKIKYNSYPIESNFYKALEKMFSKQI